MKWQLFQMHTNEGKKRAIRVSIGLSGKVISFMGRPNDDLTSRPKCRNGKSTHSPALGRRIQCSDASATTRTAWDGRVWTLGRLRPPRDTRKDGTEADASIAAPSLSTLDLFFFLVSC